MRAVDAALAGALLAQVALTIGVGVRLGITRARSVKEGSVKRRNVMLSTDGWPPYARQASNNFSNQFEVPVLFYALVLLGLQLGFAGQTYATLAWAFVVSRLFHAIVHTTSNSLKPRMTTFGIGVAIIVIMGLMAAFAVVTA